MNLNLTTKSQRLSAVLFALVISVSSISCSTSKTSGKIPEEVAAKQLSDKFQIDIHEEVVEADGLKHQLETVAILGTNDIHGALAPQELKTRETNPADSQSYTRGGAALFATHVKRLKSQYQTNLLMLDGGDEFQGSIESNLQEGAPVVRFFNKLGIHGAAIGNHEFDFGPLGLPGTENPHGDRLGALKARMSEATYSYLASNVIDKKTHALPAFPNTYTHRIYQVGTLKVGVLGLSTLQTPTTTIPTNVQSLEFTPLKEATIREAQQLREGGAQIIVITAHVGLFCSPGKTYPGHTIRKESDPQGTCNSQDEMVQLLSSLPKGTVDAVVSGHSHSLVHHFVKSIPVIQGGTRLQAYNLIYLTYDKTTGALVSDRTRIEGPIPVCEKVFDNQGDCNGDRPAPSEGRGKLVTPRFHGIKITADSEMEALLKPDFEKTEVEKKRVVAEAVRSIDHTRTDESMLGNLVTDAIRSESRSDIAIVNPGGLRAPLEQGPLTYGAIFRTLPFDNSITVLSLYGRELKQLVQIVESGSKGFYPTSGLKVTVIPLGTPAPVRELNQNGTTEPWEVDRLIELRLANGDPIHDSKLYRVATLDFLVAGGDDLAWFMSKVPSSRVHYHVDEGAGTLLRDAVVKYVTNLKRINTVESPLIDPKNPRLVFKKPGTGKKAKSRRASKKNRKTHR